MLKTKLFLCLDDVNRVLDGQFTSSSQSVYSKSHSLWSILYILAGPFENIQHDEKHTL